MGTIEDIAGRHSTRAYTSQPVPPDVLRQIAIAGLQAPSAMNHQPWRIVVVTGPDKLALLDAAGGGNNAYTYGAPAAMLVAMPVDADPWGAIDAGILVENMALAATALGVQSCIAGMPVTSLKGPDGAARAAELGVPEGYQAVISLLLGYGAQGGQGHAIDHSKVIGL
ncbi:MAG: nitroreductase [Bifidobacteriaceae bacterium]|jgi:nitroreductase|nr:nitroreductase [Bifidobacteriaceae bacterium]